MAKVTVFVVIALLGLMDYILIVACARFEKELIKNDEL